ncbi:hypothetical protein E1B28_003126 [Marasmius oreades]|uniref:Uncharacterized protein n=1 Tax=Marasmius oreades TaxID=181124 RepID=A0A9P7RLW9_9AGAR|nr:uncharacterized protein E1B28_003126 [Marasmius oreades]KAG7085570.1 hypothetical protein E1B28_003126 [Marasmius oreades]
MTSKSDSSRSTSPGLLTPESTGTNQTNSSSPEPAARSETDKKRRQTAFYPNVNSSNKPQKPFSRSAAKRQSVMTLGSIEHLQYYFTKTGLSAKQKPSVLDKPHYGLVPAIGGGEQLKIRISSPNNHSINSINEIALPPTPAIPNAIQPTFPEVTKTFEVDSDSLKPGLIEDLILVSRVWRIDPDQTRPEENDQEREPNRHFDVVGTLQATTRAIRSVRNYILSLPVESVGSMGELFRSNRFSATTIRNIKTSPSSSSTSQNDNQVSIRRSALEVLGMLRELEERYRLPLSDDAYDVQSDGGKGGSSRLGNPSGVIDDLERDHHSEAELEGLHEVDADTSVAFSLVRVHGREEHVPVWEDDENDDTLNDTEEKRERWDERLVLGSGWLYRQDVSMDDLQKEKDIVAEYLDVVDQVLFSGGQKGVGERGWLKEKRKLLDKRRPLSRNKGRRTSAGDAEGSGLGLGFSFPDASGRRRVSTGTLGTMLEPMRLSDEPSTMEGIAEEEGPEEEPGDGLQDEEGIDDDELPEWARRNAFLETPLDRCRALIHDLLPPNLQGALSPEGSSRAAFLESLSSGQLLCIAYNTGVRKSKNAWGYVSKGGIHDLIELEREAAQKGDTKAKTGWTFRRSDNLRLWVGALKLRYMLPIVTPAVPAGPRPPPSSNNTPLTSPSAQSRKFPTDEPPILFDAKFVAKKDAGWEDMLEGVLLRWMWRVVDEQRSVR